MSSSESGLVTVRQATAADDGALLELELQSWDQRSGFPSRRQQHLTHFFKDDGPSAEAHYVAEQADKIVGYARLVPVAKGIPEAAHVLLIAGLAVAPQARRIGVAHALLRRVESEAVNRNARKLMLYVLSTNDAAFNLYSRDGYVVEGQQRQQFFIDDAYVDSIIMAKHLSQ